MHCLEVGSAVGISEQGMSNVDQAEWLVRLCPSLYTNSRFVLSSNILGVLRNILLVDSSQMLVKVVFPDDFEAIAGNALLAVFYRTKNLLLCFRVGVAGCQNGLVFCFSRRLIGAVNAKLDYVQFGDGFEAL